MKELQISRQLLNFFRQCADTLIFEGYCTNFDRVQIFNEGSSYALVANVNGSYECCIKSDSESFVLELVDGLHGKIKLCGVDPFVTGCLKDKYAFNWETNCDLYVWNGQPLSYQCKQQIYPMLPKYAQKISDGTHYHAAIDEIERCLEIHPSAAILVDGEPVCWCLLHLEKSLGMLFTEPAHRHKGYALEVMTALCNKVIAKGDIPYAYIVQDNIASKNLAAKYNLCYVKQADYFEIEKV